MITTSNSTSPASANLVLEGPGAPENLSASASVVVVVVLGLLGGGAYLVMRRRSATEAAPQTDEKSEAQPR